MNPIVLSLVDGTAFFVGLAIVLTAEALLIRFRKRLLRSILTNLAIVGIILVVISATPLPIWAYLVWGIPALAGLVLLNRPALSTRWVFALFAAILTSTAGLCIAEIPYHISPRLTLPNDTTIYVIGDSISAGIETKHRCWPTVLEDIIPFRVVNLAQAGATVESAIVQARGITKPHSLVIVEIGGNDLLGGTEASTFCSKFDALVALLCSEQHQVLVFELPLFPFKNAFGKAQRSIVAKHVISMLPKRYFAEVLATENGTLDGLHLSQKGHDVMARIVARVIKQE